LRFIAGSGIEFSMVVRVEFVVCLACLAGAVLVAGKRRMLPGMPAWFKWLARHGGLAVVLVGIFAVMVSASMANDIAWPEPRVHDEFSYLLGADTFAHGRLTNPAHPLALHFETFHVNSEPTYCSIYPPAQSLFLAAGQTLGHPLIGVWISFGLACAAACWMLQAWLPPHWALAGAVLCALRVGCLGGSGDFVGYWSQSYWGGAPAMLGGALLFGALGRLLGVRRQDSGIIAASRNSLLLAIGLAVLANSRPFEGLILSLPVAVVLVGWLAGRIGVPRGARFAALILPFVLVLAPVAVAMAYYNASLTGNPLLLAYQQNARQNSRIPLFIWQPLGPEPVYHHVAMRDYQENWAEPAYLQRRQFEGYLQEILTRIRTFAMFYLGPLLLVPMVALPWVLRNRWMWLATMMCLPLVVALLMTTWFQPHYAAPATCLIFLLVTGAIRQLRLWRWHGRQIGRAYVSVLPLAYGCVLIAALCQIATVNSSGWHVERARILKNLQASAANYLIIVRYGGHHPAHEEWVFNEAGIDQSKVIWARDMGADWNRELLEYYPRRQVWLLEPDSQAPRLVPYRE
jgi:hypothetical protein